MRLQGGKVSEPTVAGTAVQWPCTLPRYSWPGLTAPTPFLSRVVERPVVGASVALD
jgi:hypothetical protein